MRVFSYFTFYNLVATIAVIVFRSRLPEAVIDIVRGTALVVVFAVAYMYIVFGVGAVLSMYQRLYPALPRWVALLYDWSIHFGPILAIGLPKRVVSLLLAYGLLLAWYWIVREQVSKLYIQTIPVHSYDTLILLVGFVLLGVGIFRQV